MNSRPFFFGLLAVAGLGAAAWGLLQVPASAQGYGHMGGGAMGYAYPSYHHGYGSGYASWNDGYGHMNGYAHGPSYYRYRTYRAYDRGHYGGHYARGYRSYYRGGGGYGSGGWGGCH